MGIATTRQLERLAASLGEMDGATLHFEVVDDVPCAGVLCALPALLMHGLLGGNISEFSLPKGFYPLESIFLSVAILALTRTPSLEQARYLAPGEFGKLLGIDRIPEVKTLRNKIAHLSDDPAILARWQAALSQQWMQATDSEIIGALLIDGHTRVYHGELTALPRRYLSRERLCLRATTDYWVNALDGQPFFCVTKAIDPGLQHVLEQEIVPRLLREMPNQPSAEALAADPLLHRFIVVFDREGYSPALAARLWQLRIAVLTYHKYPGEGWDVGEFAPAEVTSVHGETSTLQLAERGAWLASGKLWVREVRRLRENGHQTSIICTAYRLKLPAIAGTMFARWNQENYLKYMRQHYGLDKLVEQGTAPLPDSTRLVNPAWRRLDGAVRSARGKLTRQQADYAKESLEQSGVRTADEAARFEARKGAALVRMQEAGQVLEELKTKLKATPRHITLKDLPEEQRAAQLRPKRKAFIDTIKLIAYRAETTLVHIVREVMSRADDAHSLIRALMGTTGNLRPDPEKKELRIELHGQTNPIHDKAIEHLCAELNELEVAYPGSDLILKYTPLRSSKLPGGQDV